MDLKFNIRQCRGVAPWEVSSTSIILMEMVPLLYLADLENRGLFWTLCFKNDSDKPAWIKEEDSKMTQVGILSTEAQGKDLQCNQAWGHLAASMRTAAAGNSMHEVFIKPHENKARTNRGKLLVWGSNIS